MIVTIIGSDNRQRELARLFNKTHDTIYLSGSEKLSKVKGILKISDYVVFPYPFTRDDKLISTTKYSISDIAGSLDTCKCIFLGEKKNFQFNTKVIDYSEDECFTEKNAFYTAESAVALTIINTQNSLKDLSVLILGNGRIGKSLAKILKPLCDDITVSARKEKDFAYITKNGFKKINTNEIQSFNNYNIIYNTIPSKVITDDVIENADEGITILDLAAKNSGLKKHKNHIDLKALPTKYASKSSAAALYEYILNSF